MKISCKIYIYSSATVKLSPSKLIKTFDSQSKLFWQTNQHLATKCGETLVLLKILLLAFFFFLIFLISKELIGLHHFLFQYIIFIVIFLLKLLDKGGLLVQMISYKSLIVHTFNGDISVQTSSSYKK